MESSIQKPQSALTNDVRIVGMSGAHNYATDHLSMNQKETKWTRERKKKWMIRCLVGTILFMVIMIPLAIYVIIPKIAQGLINGSKMTIHSATITKPTDQTFKLKMGASVTDAGPLPAIVSFEGPIEVSWENLTLARMGLDSFKLSGGSATIDTESDVSVLDIDAFSKFNKHMVNNPNFTWKLDGKVSVKAFGLTFGNLKMEKEVTMDAMNGLKEVSIKTFDLPQDDPEKGIQIVLASEIQNPSPIAVDMGDLEFDIFIPGNDTKLGEASAQAIILNSGSNVIEMKGRLTPFSSTQDEVTISKLFTTFLGGIDTNLVCVGRRIRPQDPVEWLNAAFVGLKLQVPFKGSDKGDLIKSVTVKDMVMDFVSPGATAYSPFMSAPNIEAAFQMPFNFNLSMKKVQQTMEVVYDGTKIADVVTPMVDAKGEASIGKMTTDIVNIPFAVVDNENARAKFREFLTKVTINKEPEYVEMKGAAAIIASSKIGDMHIEKMPVKTQVKLEGFQGLNPISHPPSILSVKVVSGDERGIEMQIKVKMMNPSNVKLILGDVYFDMIYRKHKIGRVLIPNLHLENGENVLSTTARYKPEGQAAMAAGLELLNRYCLRASDISVSCKGSIESTPIESLRHTLSQISLSGMILPAIKEKMIVNTRFALTLQSLFESTTVSGMDLFNPFDTQVRIADIQADVSWYDKETGKSSVLGQIDKLEKPFSLPPRSTYRAPKIPMKLNINLEAIKAVLDANEHRLFVNVKSKLTAYIGSYGPIILDYSQNDISTTITSDP